MLRHYRGVFRAPGSAAFAAASFVMRMPIAMYPIGIVLIISAREGHYGFAGVLSGCYTFGSAIGSPLLGVLVDRLGQRRVIVPAALAHAAATVALALLVRASAGEAALVAPAALVGLTYVSVGSLVRARWTHAWEGRDELGTALSLESVLDEMIFVLGPVIATLIATHTVPVLVLYLALALVVAGSVALAVQRRTEPPAHPRTAGERHVSALRAPGMVLLTLATVPMGAVFASAEVAIVAFCGQHGHRGLSGLALALLAGGSGASGLIYGARPHQGSPAARFRRQALIFAVLPVVLFASVNVPVLLALSFVVGFGIAPALITTFGLTGTLVPARSLTEGLSWLNTGISVGYGVGASVVGAIADAHGARTAFTVVLGSALLVGVAAVLLRARVPDETVRAPDPVDVGG